MNKTLYVRDADVQLWEQAEAVAPNGISDLVRDLIQNYVQTHQPIDPQGYKRIVVTTETRDHPPVKKAFTGRWLVQDMVPDEPPNPRYSWCAGVRFSVAQMKDGRIAVYTDSNGGTADLEIFSDFDDFKSAESENGVPQYPENVIAAVASTLNEVYVIELD